MRTIRGRIRGLLLLLEEAGNDARQISIFALQHNTFPANRTHCINVDTHHLLKSHLLLFHLPPNQLLRFPPPLLDIVPLYRLLSIESCPDLDWNKSVATIREGGNEVVLATSDWERRVTPEEPVTRNDEVYGRYVRIEASCLSCEENASYSHFSILILTRYKICKTCL
jgi:hypothetical protein